MYRTRYNVCMEKIRKGSQVLTPGGYEAVVTFKPKPDGWTIVRVTDKRWVGRPRAMFETRKLTLREENR